MSKWLKKYSETFFFFLIKRRIFLPVLFCVLLPFTIRFALISWQGTENRVEDWVPGSFEETKLLVDFMSIFGSDEILMISWEGCNLDSPQLEEFRQKLLAPVMIDGQPRILYQSVFTGSALFDQLAELDIPEEEIYQKLEGWIVSRDDDTTCLLAKISSDGAIYRRQAVDLVETAANEIEGLSFETVHVAGSTMESIAIDKACAQYLIQTNLLSYMFCIILSWLCSRNIRTTLLVFGLSLFNQQVCLALIYLSGTSFSSVLMLTVNLTFVLSMSIGIHYVNYYRAAMNVFPTRLAPFAAIKRSWAPTFFSVFTTVIGLLSFGFSQIIPIYRFGIFGAASLLVSMLIMIVYLGVAFVILPVRSWDREYRKKHLEKSGKISGAISSETTTPPVILWLTEKALPTLTKKYYRHILIVSILLFVLCGGGLRYSHTAVGLKNMLLPSTKPIQDYTWIESRIGPLVPVEILFKLPGSEQDRLIDQLYILEQVQWQLQEQLKNSTVISVLNFLPMLPERRAITAKTVFNRVATNSIDQIKQSGYIQEDEQFRYLRVTARTFALGNVDYGLFTQDVKSIVKQTLAEHDPQNDISFFVSGGVPLVYRVQTQLLLDVRQSFLLAFVLIAMVLCIQLKSVPAGLLCFFPNVLPCIVVFGLIGWLGIPLEIGTILTISAALGIAVDNAIHFINWYRIAIHKGLDQSEAVNYAFRNCGPAMLQTATIFSLGMVVFAWNVFIPTITFAITISLLLTLALICDLVILPAILISPMGRFFLSGKAQKRD